MVSNLTPGSRIRRTAAINTIRPIAAFSGVSSAPRYVVIQRSSRGSPSRNSQAVGYLARVWIEAFGFAMRVWRIFQPCFLAVAMTERRQAKVRAPARVRKPPEIFILTFIILRSRSVWDRKQKRRARAATPRGSVGSGKAMSALFNVASTAKGEQVQNDSYALWWMASQSLSEKITNR